MKYIDKVDYLNFPRQKPTHHLESAQLVFADNAKKNFLFHHRCFAGLKTLLQTSKMDEDEDYTCELSEEELFEFTEKLMENDENNCAKYFRYNFQERRCGEDDVCDEPLFSDLDVALFEVPTIKTLMALHDNYVPVSVIFNTFN